MARFTAITRSASGDHLPGRIIHWHSTRPEVAQVDQSGRVAAIAQGLTTISAMSEGRTAQTVLRVIPFVEPVARVDITEGATLAIPRGGTRLLHAEARSASGTVLEGRQQLWSSSEPAIVTVSGVGIVTALSMGEARIMVTVEGTSAFILVTVLSDVVLVEMDPPTLALATNDVRQIQALPRGQGGHVINTPIMWHSLDSTIATVGSTGRVRGLRPGWTWITATAQGTVGSTLVIVSTWEEFTLAEVAGAPLPATLFTIQGDTGRGLSTVTYEALSGSLRFLVNTNRYEQAFHFRVSRDGLPVIHMTTRTPGWVELDWFTGRRVLHPENGSPAFTVESIAQGLLVRQRYVSSAPEVPLTYRSAHPLTNFAGFRMETSTLRSPALRAFNRSREEIP